MSKVKIRSIIILAVAFVAAVVLGAVLLLLGAHMIIRGHRLITELRTKEEEEPQP